jgi:hypothetical protein
LAGILGFESRPLISGDYCNDTRSSIVDGASTLVTDRTLLKVYGWYDNEVGYAYRMVDLANIVIVPPGPSVTVSCTGLAPMVLRRSADGLTREIPEARLWGTILIANRSRSRSCCRRDRR